MAVRTITITDDAYRQLKALKREGESFSDVIRRVTAGSSLSDLVGLLSGPNAASVTKGAVHARRALEREMGKHIRGMKR